MSSKRWSFLSHIRASTKKVKTKVLHSLARAKKDSEPDSESDTFVGNASVEEEGWEDGSSL
jgi:hypothetical protein